MFVKICGLTNHAGVDAAVVAGADAVGFVFADSPRRVSPDKAARLCENLPGDLVRVAVMRHPSAAEWQAVRERFAPDWLQTDAEDLRALDLPVHCQPLPVYRSGQMTPAKCPARILFEGTRSGSGEVADWREAASIATDTQLILAGGLDAANVAGAIHTVAPWGVDVSSGVEREPAEKDPEKIRLFIARARAAEKRQ
jgi:phosphoribosylanthranilate isomerase